MTFIISSYRDFVKKKINSYWLKKALFFKSQKEK